MHTLLKQLRSPYPVFNQRWKSAVISSVIVFLILSLFQPFGISTIEENKWWILLGYMAVTFCALCIALYLLPALFPTFYAERGWTLGKYLFSIFIIFLLISMGNWLYSSLFLVSGLRWGVFCIFLFFTCVIGIFPVTFMTMLNQNRLLARNLQEATEMNRHLQKAVPMPEDRNHWLAFRGGSRELVELKAGDLLAVEADGNYVKVTYRKGGKVTQTLLRATMKQAEEATADCPFVIKCHRAFLVNIRSVVKVSGNSQGYRLLLEGFEEEVPVSRAYSKEVKRWIESRDNA